MNNNRRQNLHRAIRLFALVSFAFLIYVLLDFSTSDQTEDKARLYQLQLPDLALNKAFFFKVGARQIVIVRRAQTSQVDDYLVAYALGTNLGCPLQQIDGLKLKESCSGAQYDFSGKPVNQQGFTALRVPVYNFCEDFSCIKLRM